MNLYKIYFGLRWRMISSGIRTQSWRRWLEIATSLVILTGVEWGGYLLFKEAFQFLLQQGEIGQIMLDRLFNMGWTLIFLLLIISNIITAFSTLYRQPEVTFLLSTNLSYSNIFKLKSVDNVLYSSWAIILLGLPLIIAYGSIMEINGWTLLALSVFGLIPLLLIAGALALIVAVILVRLSEFVKLRTSFILLGFSLVGLFLVYRQFNQAEMVVAGDISSMRYLGRYISNLSRIPFPIAPGYWFTQSFQSIINTDRLSLLFYMGLLITTMLVSHELMIASARKLYYRSWQVLQSRSRIISSKQSRSGFIVKRWFGKPQTQALFIKDLIQFQRTPQQWIQFLIFLLMIMIYIVNLSRIQYGLQSASDFWQRLVFILNFGFSGFIMASLITRFVFPLISMEGQNRWVLISAPLSINQIFRQKLILSVTIFFILAELVAITSGLLLRQELTLIIMTSGMLLLMSVALTSLSLGLGAIFPLYHETNPMRIVSGLGGIIAILLSLVYLGLMILAMIALYGNYLTVGSSLYSTGLVGGILLFNLIVIVLPLKIGLSAFKKSMFQ